MRKFALLFCLLSLYCPAQELINDADVAFEQAVYEDAYQLYADAADRFITDDDPIGYIHCNLKMSECKILIGEPNEGFQIATNTIDYLDRYFPEQDLIRGEAMTLLGRANLNLGRNDLALEYLEEALNQYDDMNSLEKATCLNELITQSISYLKMTMAAFGLC